MYSIINFGLILYLVYCYIALCRKQLPLFYSRILLSEFFFAFGVLIQGRRSFNTVLPFLVQPMSAP